jgi:hypothetical protein
VDGETTNGHSRLLCLQRTLMKDARRRLHSLVETQNWLPNPVDLLELNEHSPAQVQTFHSSTTSNHTVTSTTSISSVAVVRCTLRRQLERFTALQHRPAHARILGRNGHHRLPIAPALLHTDRPAAYRVSFVLGRCQHGLATHDEQGSQVRVPTPMKTSAPMSRKKTGESIPSFDLLKICL